MSTPGHTNARIYAWLADELESVARATHATKVQVNSAAVWWFCTRLTAEQRARILGEFVRSQAMREVEISATDTAPNLEPLAGTAPDLPALDDRRPRKSAG